MIIVGIVSVVFSMNCMLQQAAAETIAVYPNPVTGNSIGITLYKMPAANYRVNIINNLGVIISSTQIKHNGGTARKNIALKQTLPAGQYHLELTGTGNMHKTVEVFVRAK